MWTADPIWPYGIIAHISDLSRSRSHVDITWTIFLMPIVVFESVINEQLDSVWNEWSQRSIICWNTICLYGSPLQNAHCIRFFLILNMFIYIQAEIYLAESCLRHEAFRFWQFSQKQSFGNNDEFHANSSALLDQTDKEHTNRTRKACYENL